jgi:isopentenyl diphosphate isomerase/L-lactate dehydrogenase-like FMN-dependent dehydrogenase
LTWSVADYERLAAERLDPGALGYFAGGADDEVTLAENVAAMARWKLRPRVLVDVSAVSTATSVLGVPMSMPVVVAPVAMQRLVHPDGEVAAATAAARAGVIFCLSTLATASPLEIAERAPAGPRWLQLYRFRDAGLTRDVIDQAVEAGFEAIALTVDAPRAGNRVRDLRTGFRLPEGVALPALVAALGADACPTPAELFGMLDTTLTWRGFESLAAESPLPVLLKGIQTGEDAALACEHGAAGVIVSNHGGRQLDGVAATIDVLPEVVDAVDERLPVLMDGGVRRGTDVLRALALGAQAVLAGRAPLWGLAVDGEAGAAAVLAILHAEIERGLILLGCPTPQAVTRAHVGR